MMAPTKSSVVLVARSALGDLQKIMEKLDSLSEDIRNLPMGTPSLKMMPYVVILFIRDDDMVPDTVRHAMSPPVVSLQVLH